MATVKTVATIGCGCNGARHLVCLTAKAWRAVPMTKTAGLFPRHTWPVLSGRWADAWQSNALVNAWLAKVGQPAGFRYTPPALPEPEPVALPEAA